jgi:PmbA protein
MIDDPLNPNGLESAAFDDEGTPHQICPIVVDGVLKDYFYDIYSAGKDKRETNGHGMKESLGSLPQPSPTNFYIKPGLTSFDELTHSHKKVFLVRDVMGLHMVDPVTGEFSLGASGSLYENGAFSHAVRGVTLAGTFSELLKKVIGVGIDLTWYGSRGTPSLLISSLSVGGA